MHDSWAIIIYIRVSRDPLHICVLLGDSSSKIFDPIATGCVTLIIDQLLFNILGVCVNTLGEIKLDLDFILKQQKIVK